MRECGCPPWAKPCVHFDGQILVLADFIDPVVDDHTCRLGGPQYPAYRVGFVGDYVRCPIGGGCPALMCSDSRPWLGAFDDLAAARDEFDRRAAQLVQESA